VLFAASKRIDHVHRRRQDAPEFPIHPLLEKIERPSQVDQ